MFILGERVSHTKAKLSLRNGIHFVRMDPYTASPMGESAIKGKRRIYKATDKKKRLTVKDEQLPRGAEPLDG